MKIKKLNTAYFVLLGLIASIAITLLVQKTTPASDNLSLTIEQIRYAAQKMIIKMGKNGNIVHVTPLFSPKGEIKAYEVVLSLKNYTSWEELIRDVTDPNAPTYSNNFYTVVMGASRDMGPLQFGLEGLPITFKLKFFAVKELKKTDPSSNIVNGKFLYAGPPFVLYYFETNSGNKYLFNPDPRRGMSKVSGLNDVSFNYTELSEELKLKRQKEWSVLLEGME